MKESELSDFRPLLERIVKGDERAFSLLYDLFSADLTRHILSKVSDYQVAEDILHDLFLSLWRNRHNMLEIASLPAYLYSSCRYLILAHYRQELKRANPVNLEELDLLDETVPLEDRLHYRYVIDMVNHEIENLPDKCRAVFKLSRHEYLTNKEIAARMDISESTVEKHINKAISKLRDISKNFLLFF